MSQIGCMTLPGDVLSKVYAGVELNDDELSMYAKHPAVGAKLLEQIPRLENVVKIIALQQMRFDEYDEKIANEELEEVMLGAQVLKTVADFDRLLFQGKKRSEALQTLQQEKGAHNPKVLQALNGIKIDKQRIVVSIRVADIGIGMIAAEDIVASNGSLVAPKGQAITWPIMQGVKNFAKQIGIVEPIQMSIEQAVSEEKE